MEKMTLKNKILSVIAILLCLVIIGTLVQMISTIANANESSSDEDLSGFDVVFNGKTNILFVAGNASPEQFQALESEDVFPSPRSSYARPVFIKK